MSDQFVLRLAQLSDFAFCQRLYFEGMGSIIETLKLDMARQRESFGQQWRLAEVRIIAVAGNDVRCLRPPVLVNPRHLTRQITVLGLVRVLSKV